MRVQNRKRIHIQPIKSPSPDIANRNIITDTVAPLDDIKKFNQTRSGSKSPKISRSFCFNSNNPTDTQKDRHIQMLKQQNNNLYQRIRILEKKLSQSQAASSENNKLRFQINFLKEQIERLKTNFNLSKFDNRLQSIKNQKKPYQEKQKAASSQILKQFNDRIQRSNQQNKKLLKQIQQYKTMINFLNRQIQMLKIQKQYSKKSYLSQFLENNKNASSKEIEPQKQKSMSKIKSLSELPLNIKGLIEEIFNNYQKTVDEMCQKKCKIIEEKLKDYDLKISKIKVLQNIADQKMLRLKNELNLKNIGQTPRKQIKYNPDIIGTNWKSSTNGQKSRDRQPQIPSMREKDNVSELNLDQSIKNSPIKLLVSGDDTNKSILEQNDKLKKENEILNQRSLFLQYQLQQTQLKLTQKQQRIYLLERRIQEMNRQQEAFRSATIKNESRQTGASSFNNKNNYSSNADQRDFSSTPMFRPSSINPNTNLSKSQVGIYKQKISNLQNELQQKIRNINNLQEQIQLKKRQNQQLKNKADQLDKLLDKSADDIKKVTQLNNKKIQQSQLSKKQLQDSLQQTLEKVEYLQKQCNFMKIELQEKNKKLEYLRIQMERRDQFVAQTLRQYIKNIQQLKQKISHPDLDNALKKIQEIEINFISLSGFKDQNEEIVKELKTKLLQRQKYILDLQEQIKILKFKFDQAKSKQEKLVKLIQQYSYKPNTNESQGDRMKTIIKSSKYSIIQDENHNNGCFIKECLKETWNGLDNMENKIKLILKQ